MCTGTVRALASCGPTFRAKMFFHKSALPSGVVLSRGQRFRFSVGEHEGRPCAVERDPIVLLLRSIGSHLLAAGAVLLDWECPSSLCCCFGNLTVPARVQQALECG